jgi:hypothetical protein
MDIPPHRLCCGQPHFGAVCPDGKVMCCVCFGRFPVNQLFIDPADGRPVDVCTSCAAIGEDTREHDGPVWNAARQRESETWQRLSGGDIL